MSVMQHTSHNVESAFKKLKSLPSQNGMGSKDPFPVTFVNVTQQTLVGWIFYCVSVFENYHFLKNQV